jgi:KDEL-tailed cysteine endopeptidase
MRVFAVLAIALLVCVAAEKTEDEYTFLFNAWKLQHGRDYTGDEHAIRYNIFKDNARIIEAHNLRNDVSYTMGLNKFSDLSHDEFKAQMTSPMAPRVQKNIADFSNAPAAPAAVDWVAKGAVTPVKNQQQVCVKGGGVC